MSYQSVPEVEHGGSRVPPADGLIARAKEKYPEAGTDIEAEFLGRLDDAIENCRPKVCIPRMGADELGVGNNEEGKTAQGFPGFVTSLKYTTVALVIILASAFIVNVTHSSVARAAYPYFACLVIFAASVPCIRQRFLDSIRPVFEKFTSMQSGIEREVEGVVELGMSYLDVTESSMNRALAPISQKLAGITKLETALRQIDPTIDIPDPSDIEKLFDEYQGKLKSSLDGTQNMVDVSRFLPLPLQSLSNVQIYIVLPFLAVMLVLQLIVVYQIKMGSLGEAMPVELADEGTPDARRALMEVWRFAKGRFLKNKATSPASNTNDAAVIADSANEANQWVLVWIAILFFAMTVAQIALAFLLTQARVIVITANRFIAESERDVNGKLKSSVGDVFEDIFEKGFGLVKAKFLKLVRQMDKLEEPVRSITGGIASLQSVGGSGGKLLGLMGIER